MSYAYYIYIGSFVRGIRGCEELDLLYYTYFRNSLVIYITYIYYL